VHVPEPVKGDVEGSRVREGAGGGRASSPWPVGRLRWADHEGSGWPLRGMGVAMARERGGDAASRHDPMRASAGPIMRLGCAEDAVSGGGRRGIRWGKTRYPVGEDAVSGGGMRGTHGRVARMARAKTRYPVGEDAGCARGCTRLGRGRRGMREGMPATREGKTRDGEGKPQVSRPEAAPSVRPRRGMGQGKKASRRGKTRLRTREGA
jgi:hypothetical protein